MLAPAVGAPEPARAVDGFLSSWSYGMGLIGHQVTELALMLEASAVAFDAVEARLSVAGGGATPAAPPTPITAAPELPPLPRPLGARWGDMSWTRVPVQLSAARYPRELLPGEPEDVEHLAVALRGFAVTAADAQTMLRQVSLGGWVGAAATVFANELDQVPGRLSIAADAFAEASGALRTHARALSDGQLAATVALRTWQDAEAQSQIWRGVTTGADTTSDTDPGLEGMARAAAMLASAREDVAASGRSLVSGLDAAAATAPNDPGLFARMARAVRGFAGGFGEGTAGLVEGAVGVAALAARLSPTRAMVDPRGYLDAVESFGKGVAAAASHPGETIAAVTDWETWTTDPALALGHLAPDLILALTTAGAGTAASVPARLGEAGRLGRFAPPLRAVNDLRLPRDAAKPLECRRTCGDPVDVASGDVILDQVDVTLPALLALTLSRTHVSSYRCGQWFGRSWASTLDQRLEIEPDAVYLLGQDGMRLVYAVPTDEGPSLPAYGPRWPLRGSGKGRWSINDPWSGRTLHFAAAADPTVLPLSAITDRNGHRVEIDRADNGTPRAVTHSGGYRVAVDTDGGRITAIRLRSNSGDAPLVRYEYDESGNLAAVVNSSDQALRFAYDAAGRLAEWRDRNGVAYSYRYDNHGRCVATSGAGGHLNGTFAYDLERHTTVATDSLGHPTQFELDEAGRVIREVDPLGNTTAFVWDDQDRLLARTDALARTTRHTWNDAGDLTEVVQPDGSSTVVRYNELHLPVAVVGPDGAAWTHTYDQTGNLTATMDPLGAATTYCYDEGRLTAVTDALGYVTRIQSDSAGLPVEVTEPAGGTTRYRRDGFGRVVVVTDPADGTTRFTWTVEGKIASRIGPDGASERWSYDGEGNLVEHVDPVGHVTRFEYMSFDLPAARTDPDGSRTSYAYDTELRLTSVTDPGGLEWRYERDAVGNVVREVDVNGRVLSYVYDAAGQLVESVNGLGQRAHLTRDLVGNITKRLTPDAVTIFIYDPAGRLIHATNPDADLVLDRDALGRVIAETCNGRTVSSTYDSLGRRLTRLTPAGVESRWEYGPGPAPLALHTAGTTMTFEYDAAGRPTECALGDIPVVVNTWDANHRLAGQSIGADGHQRRYRHRADGNLLGIDDEFTGGRNFDLDPLGRVVAARSTEAIERFGYDPSGNITSATSSPEFSGPLDEAYGDRQYSGTLIRQAGRIRYEHDAGGRTTLRHQRRSAEPETWRYTWDADDRLVGATTPDGHGWHYRYDPLGRRIAKERLTDDRQSVTETTEFFWDSAVLVEQTQEFGSSRASSTTWHHEPGTFRPINQVTHIQTSGEGWVVDKFRAIVADLIGTPTDLVDPIGAVTPLRPTTLSGAPLGPGQPDDPCLLEFPGQYLDDETGLHYNFHRYYDPAVSRYVSPDPLGLAAGHNPFSYTRNPLTSADPLGLIDCRNSPVPTAMPPATIRFSQSSVTHVDPVTHSMRINGWLGQPIDVVRMPDSGLTTLDNTRVLAAHRAGIEVRVSVRLFQEHLPHDMIGRFTTPKGGAPTTWGEAAMNRIGGQNSIFRNTHPYGSPVVGWGGG